MALSKILTSSVADQVLSSRNILINGAATVHQRGNQATTNGGSVYFVDRFNVFHNSAAAVANLQQSTDTPSGQGFGNSMLIDVTTADTSIAAGEIAVLRQILEGQNLQQLKYGTSSAESLTLSFWVKSPKTGVHICELYHNASTAKTQSQSYTVSSANTWEKHSVTFSGDTAATLDNDNQYTIAVQWGLFAGTSYNGSTLQTTWANLSDQTKRFAGQVNLFDSTSNNFYLTGVQLEIGDVATPFEHEDFATTLRKCKRYYEILDSDIYPSKYGSSSSIANYLWTEQKRADPTITADTNSGSHGLYVTHTSGGYFYKGAENYDHIGGVRGDAEL